MDQGDAVDAHGMGALLERRTSSESRSGAAVRLELLMIHMSVQLFLDRNDILVLDS